jgi:hypothetical protein
MFDKIGRLAETAATKVSLSRRGFLGRLGQGALAAAGALGGLLALSNKAQAAQHTLYSCDYRNTRGGFFCSESGCPYAPPLGPYYYLTCGPCPRKLGVCCTLYSQTPMGTC